MSRRKLIILSFNVLFYAVLISQNASFSQSKKKQIEALNFKIDSVNQVIANERNAHKTSIGSLESQEFKSKQKVDSLTKAINTIEQQISTIQNDKQIIESEISRLKMGIENKRDSLSKDNSFQVELGLVKKGMWINDFLKDWDQKNIQYNKRQVEGGYEYEFIDVFLNNELYYTIYRDAKPDDKCFCYIMENTLSGITIHSDKVKLANTTLKVGSTIADFHKQYGTKNIELSPLDIDVYHLFYLDSDQYSFGFEINKLDDSILPRFNSSKVSKNLKIVEINLLFN
jgi:hypothetical protein